MYVKTKIVSVLILFHIGTIFLIAFQSHPPSLHLHPLLNQSSIQHLLYHSPFTLLHIPPFCCPPSASSLAAAALMTSLPRANCSLRCPKKTLNHCHRRTYANTDQVVIYGWLRPTKSEKSSRRQPLILDSHYTTASAVN